MSISGESYETIYHEESFGVHGAFGIKILAHASGEHDMRSDAIRTAVYRASDGLKAEIMADVVQRNPAARCRRAEERDAIISLFPQPIFVEEIPNGYCSQWCCRHLPWFVVTTTIGRFKIGWRKQVISIDWSDSLATKAASDLFPGENVTKDGRLIHAWSCEKAKEYIATVMASVKE